MRDKITKLVEHKAFNYAIIAIIIINTIAIAVQTQCSALGINNPALLTALDIIDNTCLAIYIIEMFLKFYAWRIDYFKNGWNIFDFTIIVLSLIPFAGFNPQIIRFLRVLRIVRILRLIAAVKDLRRVLEALLRSLPGIGSTLLLLVIMYFVYCIIGVELFGDVAPEYFGDIGTGMLSMFQLTTMENWTAISDPVLEVYPLAWIYFVSFIVITAFVIINIILGIMVDALETNSEVEEARDEENFTNLNKQMDDLRAQLAQTNEILAKLAEQQSGNQSK